MSAVAKTATIVTMSAASVQKRNATNANETLKWISQEIKQNHDTRNSTTTLFLNHDFFGLKAARVRVPGRSPFSQLIVHETDKSNFVRKTKTIIFKGQTNERINQTNSSQIIPAGSSEEEEDRRRGVRDACDKSVHSIVGAGSTDDDKDVKRSQQILAEMSGENRITRSTACLKIGKRKQLNQPRSGWNRVKWKCKDVQRAGNLRSLSNVILHNLVRHSQTNSEDHREKSMKFGGMPCRRIFSERCAYEYPTDCAAGTPARRC